jgi:hypothetical protein
MSTKKAAIPLAIESHTPNSEEMVQRENAAFDAGYAKARQQAMAILLKPSDNLGDVFAEALYWAGHDKDKILWLSVEARDRGLPTHQLNRIAKLLRDNKRTHISSIPPYRVTAIK